MDTVIQSFLGIAVSLALSGCLVNTPPGVDLDTAADTAAETTKTVVDTVELCARRGATRQTVEQGDFNAFDDHLGSHALVVRRRCFGGGFGLG